jgi:hypothetical protein
MVKQPQRVLVIWLIAGLAIGDLTGAAYLWLLWRDRQVDKAFTAGVSGARPVARKGHAAAGAH